MIKDVKWSDDLRPSVDRDFEEMRKELNCSTGSEGVIITLYDRINALAKYLGVTFDESVRVTPTEAKEER